MVTTLTNDGWSNGTSGDWTKKADTVIDNEEGIQILDGTTANTLNGNDSLTGSGGVDDSNAGIIQQVLDDFGVSTKLYFGVENFGNLVMGKGKNSITGIGVGVEADSLAYGIYNEENSSITMYGNQNSITGEATGDGSLVPFSVAGIYNRSGNITIENGNHNSIYGKGTATTIVDVDEGKGVLSIGIFNRQAGTIAIGDGNHNSITGEGGYYNGIYNRGDITIGNGNNNSISGTGVSDGAYGIYNQDYSVVDPNFSPPSIKMGNGNNNSITAISKGSDSIGLVNEGTIDIGNGNNNSITGIAEEGGFAGIGNAGTITMGNKKDYLTGMGSISILNFGEIDMGGGNDEVIAKDGLAGGGNIKLGKGNDLIAGFGEQFVDGGKGFDIAELGIASDEYQITRGTSSDSFDVKIGNDEIGFMTFTDVEKFVFTDGTYNLNNLPIT